MIAEHCCFSKTDTVQKSSRELYSVSKHYGLKRVILCKQALWLKTGGAGMAQWWERSPRTIVSRVRFPDPASLVGWVCCWLYTLLREVFLWVFPFSPSPRNPRGGGTPLYGLFRYVWIQRVTILGYGFCRVWVLSKRNSTKALPKLCLR